MRRQRSLGDRLMVYVLSSLAGFILLIGVATFFVIKHLLDQETHDRLNLDLQQAVLAIEKPLEDDVNSLQLLAKHPLLANGLTDSIGRDTYLKPFFLEQPLAKQAHGDLLLVDFSGQALLSSSESIQNWPEAGALVQTVLNSAQPLAKLSGHHLVMVFPVIFPLTGSSEGAVLYRVDLERMLGEVGLKLTSILTIICGDQRLSTTPATDQALIELSQPLNLPPPLDSLSFGINVALPEHTALQPLYRMLQVYVLTALLLLLSAAWLAKGLSRRLLKNLNTLITQVDTISSTEQIPARMLQQESDQEINRLAQAFDHLLVRLHKAYSHLESEVATRTADLRAAQEASRQTALYARSLIEASLDPLVTISADGKITDVNKAMEIITGQDRHSLIGSDFSHYCTDPEQAQRGNRQVYEDGQVADYPLAIRHVSGSCTEVQYNAALYRNINGEVAGIFAAARDVTQQKHIEHELRQAKIAAEEASKAKSDFLANMSHEIRTPMNAIIGLTELAQDHDISNKQRDYLGKIQLASKSLLGIINDILDFSKIEAGKIEIESNPFLIEELVQDIADLFATPIAMKGMELFVDIAAQVPVSVQGDITRIRQVLNNLVNNALKFTERGEIVLKVDVSELDASRCVLHFSVRDTGIGLSQNEMDRLFQSFTQADASISRRFGGTGLGLAISKQLLTLMGGEIAVNSQPDEGSTFSFTVPVGIVEPYRLAAAIPLKANARALVVDDVAISCLILQGYLQSWGFDVQTSLSGSAALQAIRQAEQDGNPFELLLLDWKMPEMDGLQLMTHIDAYIRQGHLQRPPTIIMVTDCCRNSLLQEIADYPAQPIIISKPVSMSALYNAILNVYQPGMPGQLAHRDRKVSAMSQAKPIVGSYVLLVEDNALNQQIVREFLQKAGLRLVVAEHGAEAVAWAQREHFDAILMDVQMPIMDGFEATRRIRALPGGEQVPIIAMTAAAMQHDREACLAAGMNDHLAKPLSSKQLIEKLVHWIKPGNPLVPKQTMDNATTLSPETPPGFDFSQILPLLDNDFGQLLTVLKMFRQDFANAARQITDKLAGGELHEAERLLHQLKGVAGNIGAKALYTLSQTLDEQLKQQHYDAQLLSQWQTQLADTLQTIDSYTANTPLSVVTTAGTDRETCRQLAANLDERLVQHDFIANDLTEQLRNALEPDQLERYDALLACIRKLDYSGARAVLATLVPLTAGNT